MDGAMLLCTPSHCASKAKCTVPLWHLKLSTVCAVGLLTSVLLSDCASCRASSGSRIVRQQPVLSLCSRVSPSTLTRSSPALRMGHPSCLRTCPSTSMQVCVASLWGVSVANQTYTMLDLIRHRQQSTLSDPEPYTISATHLTVTFGCNG